LKPASLGITPTLNPNLKYHFTTFGSFTLIAAVCEIHPPWKSRCQHNKPRKKQKKMKRIAIGMLAAGIVASSAFAGDDTVGKEMKAPVPALAPCFKDQEFQVDLWGSITELSSGNREGQFGTPRRGGGGGIGVNYFFIRYLGIGVDGDLSSAHHELWNTTAKLIVRVPFDFGGLCLAPYVFSGGGGAFASSQYGNDSASVGAFMLGGGLEYRIKPYISIFAEGRYTWAGESDTHPDLTAASGRFGLRISF
jgi:opacity protein-like surface antigen